MELEELPLRQVAGLTKGVLMFGQLVQFGSEGEAEDRWDLVLAGCY